MAKPNWKNRTLWTGDNLDILRGMNSESVDLIYLDPPFNSNQNFSAPIGSEAAGAAFKDTWTLSDIDEAWHGEIADKDPTLYAIIDAAGLSHGKSMKSYLIMMAVRLLEMRRLLKPTGSLYLHCDSTAGHYLKTMADGIFGTQNFRNAIIWKRTTTHSDSKTWSRISDTILFYSKDKSITWNVPYSPHTDEHIDKKYKQVDSDGRRYTLSDMTSPNPRPNMMYEWKGFLHPAKGWRYSQETMARLDEEGRIWYPTFQDGSYDTKRRPRLKRYLEEMKGNIMGDIWTDISPINSQAKERTGYPTQKPLKLLDRIIQASSNPGDMMLDPFAGCATACVSAERLGRQWVGIDLSPLAARLVKSRLEREMGLFYDITHREDIPRRTDLGKLANYRTHKHTLYGKQEGICAGCLIMFPFRNMTIDHVIPQSKGGSDHLENLQLLCGACNSMKGTRSQEEFIAPLKAVGMRQ